MARNVNGLDDIQIERCLMAWEVLGGQEVCSLDVSKAKDAGSLTVFNQTRRMVYLGADVLAASDATDARSRMSYLACLAHELAHAERFFKHGYDRPFDKSGKVRDEAETSLDASFNMAISRRDRTDLVEDARDRTIDWLHSQDELEKNGYTES